MLKILWWPAPLCVLVSFGASLLVMWLLSTIIGFSMDSTSAAIIGMLTAAASGTCLTAVFLSQRKE